MQRLQQRDLRYAFVGHGQTAGPLECEINRLYLDVGNELRIGCVDHHGLAAHAGSTAHLVLAHPDLIQQSVQTDQLNSHAFTFVLHEDPDLDGIASVYLARQLLTTGAFPDGAAALVAYVDRVDQGYPGISLEFPHTLYAACMVLSNRLSMRNWVDPKELWQQRVDESLRIIEFVVREAARDDLPIPHVDAFRCPGLFGPQDRDELCQDIARYRDKLEAPATCARRLKLRLPCAYGGSMEVETLLVRDVQNSDDPERVVFFKDWARSDPDNSSDKNGFKALCVHSSASPQRPARTILSVTPDSGVSLQGLGTILEAEETKQRIDTTGVDDRDIDPATGQRKEPRWKGASADPWYDGRGSTYTIVDSPHSGTQLSASRIEELFVQYGRRAPEDIESLVLPTPEDVSRSEEEAEDTVRFLSSLLVSPPSGKSPSSTAPPEIFISYPRCRLEWVEENIRKPLATWRGEDRIFFDQNTINAGEGWLARIAEGVDQCRAFLPVLCSDYFQRPFCQWELQLAVIRDPIGAKRIVIPLMIEPVPLPAYCRLLQCNILGSHQHAFDLLQRTLLEIL